MDQLTFQEPQVLMAPVENRRSKVSESPRACSPLDFINAETDNELARRSPIALPEEVRWEIAEKIFPNPPAELLNAKPNLVSRGSRESDHGPYITNPAKKRNSTGDTPLLLAPDLPALPSPPKSTEFHRRRAGSIPESTKELNLPSSDNSQAYTCVAGDYETFQGGISGQNKKATSPSRVCRDSDPQHVTQVQENIPHKGPSDTVQPSLRSSDELFYSSLENENSHISLLRRHLVRAQSYLVDHNVPTVNELQLVLAPRAGPSSHEVTKPQFIEEDGDIIVGDWEVVHKVSPSAQPQEGLLEYAQSACSMKLGNLKDQFRRVAERARNIQNGMGSPNSHECKGLVLSRLSSQDARRIPEAMNGDGKLTAPEDMEALRECGIEGKGTMFDGEDENGKLGRGDEPVEMPEEKGGFFNKTDAQVLAFRAGVIAYAGMKVLVGVPVGLAGAFMNGVMDAMAGAGKV